MAPISFSISVTLTLILSSILSNKNLISFSFITSWFLAFSSTFLIALSAYIYNDITDLEIDRLNKPNRPLVKGEASEKEAKFLAAFLGLISLIFSLLINLEYFIFMLILSTLMFLYSLPPIRLKNRFLIKNLTIAAGSFLTYIMGGAASNFISAPILLMGALGFISALGTSALVDIEDIKGDQTYSAKTLPVVWGPSLTVRFAIMLVILAGVGITVGYYQIGFNAIFLALGVCTLAAWIYVVYPLFRLSSEQIRSVEIGIFVRKIFLVCLLLQILTLVGAIM
ncbi:MAG: UbiA family prenyltransferase [Candidatus Bathyarchaeia archaeon]